MLELDSPAQAAAWLRRHVTGTLQTDSRKLAPGDGFIAWPGAANDARAHVQNALTRGATACLVERSGVADYHFSDPHIAAYWGLKAASGRIAAEFFDQPSHHISVLAVTGTNGKTSTVWWLAQALSSTRLHPPMPCAMVGTLGVGHPPATNTDPGSAPGLGSLLATGLTTPDPVLLQACLRQFVDTQAAACAIEASSIGIEEHRLDGTQVHTAIFTNFTQDHLDYHGSMGAYWRAKARLFQWPGLRAAVINIDDPRGMELAAGLDDGAIDLWTVSCGAPARLRAAGIAHTQNGLCFNVVEADVVHRLDTWLIGQYNISNLLGVIAAMRALGVPLADAVAACGDLEPVPGRMQCVNLPGKPLVAVDYAHTPDALEKALAALRPLTAQRGGALWCVFGCGGDRDPVKRPLMGAAAAQGADHIVLTSDNPRNENPLDIMRQILPALAGHRSVTQQADRALAITQTLQCATAQDVILVAGKGHEIYQETAGLRLAFSDLEQVEKALTVWHTPAPAQGVAA
ncbi:MAG: UDP-N-acetylmuramoyl-L-alanyl-D-glutamate--2,6-diaminopimelate ligase [Rhodoferax sp.]|nr:UDP-N-acetylmuramoyl-L-alanyl-D-glutamate--2,6-diaminopimelate ligase [Rhodoferax sp.]